MNNATADKIRALCLAAAETVSKGTLTAAKALIESAIADSTNAADLNPFRDLFNAALSHRTKAGFSEALSVITNEVEQRLSEGLFNDRVKGVIERAKAENRVTYNEYEVAAAIRAIPFFSYSAVIKLLREWDQSAVTDSVTINSECLRAGATVNEAEDYGYKHGKDALNAFLHDVSLKRMRFHYLRTNLDPMVSESDREFACSCLLKVARRETNNDAIRDLFNDVDALRMGEVIPPNLKRRLIDWALAF